MVGEPFFVGGVPLVLDRKGLGDAGPGDLAVVRSGRGRAQLERVLGKARDIETVLEGLLVHSGARREFQPYTAPDQDLSDRVDLRDQLTFTIDPATAKDFDDALSVREEDGGFRAWVHIADVSAYVQAGSPLDRGAAERAFTTYVPGLAAPMLPPELADDRCSLRPNEDRLCVTVELPPSGPPQFYRSVIAAARGLRTRRPSGGRRSPTSLPPSSSPTGSPPRSAIAASRAAHSGSRAPRSRSSSTATAASRARGRNPSRPRTGSSRN